LPGGTLGHLVAGRTNTEIARDLFISDRTVSVYVTNVLRKTGTANMTDRATTLPPDVDAHVMLLTPLGTCS